MPVTEEVQHPVPGRSAEHEHPERDVLDHRPAPESSARAVRTFGSDIQVTHDAHVYAQGLLAAETAMVWMLDSVTRYSSPQWREAW